MFLPGPNVALGHSPALLSEELQVRYEPWFLAIIHLLRKIQYALQLIRPVIEEKARSFEIRQSTSDAYNEDLQRRLMKTTWASCRSYYRAGGSNTGKIVATFPGSLFRQWSLTRKVKFDEYTVVEMGE
jgi:hypothetical protein